MPKGQTLDLDVKDADIERSGANPRHTGAGFLTKLFVRNEWLDLAHCAFNELLHHNWQWLARSWVSFTSKYIIRAVTISCDNNSTFISRFEGEWICKGVLV